MTNDEHNDTQSQSEPNTAAGDDERRTEYKRSIPDVRSMNRRRILKASTVGAMVAGLGVLPGTTVAESSEIPDPEKVDPSDEESLEHFTEEYLQLDSVNQAEKAWSGLTDKQEQAVVETIHKNWETRTETVTTEGSASSDSVSPQAIPVSFSHTVEHIVLGQVIYNMTHTIEWEVVPPYTTVSNISRSTTGGTNVPFWNWNGVVDTDLDTFSSYFDSYVEGEVVHTVPNNTYNPVIELRGNADGSGTVLQADNGF